ncbi:hypothetical protein [Lysinibacillus sp. Bpr_S20]|uniref:hypothetical protein n=1 Tax=Lysinibacillus sp. Bpr_S20 TaxID=2933964 RepID=UPI002013B2ED|nr:hypothetical protein [Lysinibacillus sp. Bpr_S20]MCL1700822.1 hypothetical protein [Lysinibacillus sp. Bpr_S20]
MKNINNLTRKEREEVIRLSMNHSIVNGKAYDNETGEYIGDRFQHEWLTPIKKTFKNINPLYTKENKNAIEIHCEGNGGFVFALFKSNSSILDRLPLLSKQDIARLMYIATFTHYHTGRLQKGDGTVITTDTFPALVRLTKQRATEYLNRLIDSNVVTVSQYNELLMSKEYFLRGTVKDIESKSINYTRLFKKTVRDLFQNASSREITHLSTIYMTLPYINLYHNVISYNPHENDPYMVRAMDTKILANELGYKSYNKLTTMLNKLTINDKKVFNYYTDINDRRKRNIVVNPDVVYAGNSAKQLESVKVFFNTNS